jgi:hypothetical protein
MRSFVDAESHRLDYTADRALRRESRPQKEGAASGGDGSGADGEDGKPGNGNAGEDAVGSETGVDLSAGVDEMFKDYRSDERAFLVMVGLASPERKNDDDA